MSAKSTELGKVQEIYDVIVLTKWQIESDFDALLEACFSYCEDVGVDLE